MTGTERIKEKIIEDAKTKAQSIEEQAKQEARILMEQAFAESEQKRAELLEKAKADGETLHKRLVAVAELDGRKELLKTKQELIEEAFQRALEKICLMTDQDYQALLERMIAEAAGNEDGEIMLSEKDAKRMNDRFVGNINRRIADSGKNGTVKLSDRFIETSGGFILKYGEVEINSTFEILFDMLRMELEPDIVRILFEG
jgi:V/A-type H+-transporting ATPase subunit E